MKNRLQHILFVSLLLALPIACGKTKSDGDKDKDEKSEAGVSATAATDGESLGKLFFASVQSGKATALFPSKDTALDMSTKMMDAMGGVSENQGVTAEMKKQLEEELAKYDDMVAQQAEALVNQYKDQFEGGTYVKTEVKDGAEMFGMKSGTLTIHYTDKDKNAQTVEVPYGAYNGQYFAGGGM